MGYLCNIESPRFRFARTLGRACMDRLQVNNTDVRLDADPELTADNNSSHYYIIVVSLFYFYYGRSNRNESTMIFVFVLDSESVIEKHFFFFTNM